MIAGFIFELSADGTIQYLNPAVTQLTGYSPEELQGVNWWQTFFPHQDEAAVQACQDQILNNDESQVVMPFAAKDGSLVELEIHTALQRGAYGRLKRITGFAASVDCNQPVQEALSGEEVASPGHLSKTSQKYYKTIFEHTLDAVLIANDDDRFIDANPAACQLLGYSRDELLQMSIRDLFSITDQDQFDSLWRAFLAGGDQKGEVRLMRKDGSALDVEYHATANILPGMHLSIMHDASERVLAEQALQESEARYRSLFEDSPMSLWEEDFSGMKAYLDALREQGIGDLRAYFAARPEAVFECLSRATILDVNRATLEIYHAAAKDELLGSLDRVLDPGCHRDYAEGLISIAEGRMKFEIETVNRTLQGEPIDIVLSWSVAPGSESTYDKVLVSVFDITERKRIERAERDQRALAEALRDVSSALNSALNFEEVLDRILENIARVAEFDTADLLLVEEGLARIVRHRGYQKFGLDADDMRPMCFEISAMRSLYHMVASGQPLVISDTDKFQGWLDIPELRFIKSFAGAPIRVGGNVIGFLNITSTEPDFYDQNYAPRLQALADQAAIALQNAKLFDQVLAGRERLRTLTHELVLAQEAERHRLSRELHDQAGQSLTALKISLQLVHDEIAPQAAGLRQLLADSIDLVESTMDRMRHLAQNLRPPALDAIGLIPTLRDFCEVWSQQTGLAINFESGDIPDLPDEITLALYRFLQEALTNVSKHATATNVFVNLSSNAGEVALSVIDDGTGFDVGKIATIAGGARGMGLLGMQERLDLLGGKLDLDTAPGSGTMLVARVPLKSD